MTFQAILRLLAWDVVQAFHELDRPFSAVERDRYLRWCEFARVLK